jgi:hypothetical protein
MVMAEFPVETPLFILTCLLLFADTIRPYKLDAFDDATDLI